MKPFIKLNIEGNYLKVTKIIHENPTINIILDSKKLKDFSLRSRTRQRCLFSPFLFNMVLEIIVKVIKEKRHPKWKERSKIVFVCR
jgi:hypothetical protein